MTFPIPDLSALKNGPQPQQGIRILQINEVADPDELNGLLQKNDWMLLNIFPNTSRQVDEMACVYIMAHVK